ncbi:MAG: hypothetical protein HY298_04335 [Verrucomicrobia bacterium]|nr:hypothetical protein [Verrucomicrobiota bacterium]
MKPFAIMAFMSSMAVVRLLAEDSDQPQQAVNITTRGSFNFGLVDGFLQTPAGGRPGTSTHQRPTLADLNIRDVGFYDMRLDLQWQHFDFYGGYQIIGLDGSGNLARSLISHGVSFAAGDQFTTQNQFNWFNFGGGWRFDLLDGRLELFPKTQLAVLDFSYQLSTATQTARRSYAKGAGRFGLESAYCLNPIVSFHFSGDASIPLSNTPQIATLTATVNFKLAPKRHRVNPSVFIGGGGELIDYRDNQRLPNHVRAEIGPFITAGAAISF